MAAAALRAPGALLGAAWELVDGVGSSTAANGYGATLLAAAATLAIVPVTHGVGGRLLFGAASWSPRATLFKGGAAFITFQVLAWTFWGATVLAGLAAAADLLAAFAHGGLPSTVLAGAAVCGSVLAEVLMVSSLLTFQEAAPPPGARLGAAGGSVAAASSHRRTQSERFDYDFGWDSDDDTRDDTDSAPAVRGLIDAVWTPAPPAAACASPERPAAPPAAQPAPPVPSPQRHRRTVSAAQRREPLPMSPRIAAVEDTVHTLLDALRGHAGAALIICLCVLLSLTGHGLVVSVAVEAVAGTSARLLFISIAMVCIIIAGPVTHGLGGRLRHAKTGEWRFFQPWRGGVAFVACQGLGWALYSVSIVAFVAAFWLIGGALAGHGVPDARVVLPATFWLAGASGVAAQVVLACSLLTYRPPASAAAVPLLPTPPPAPPRREGVALQHAAMMSVLLMVYAPCHLLVAAIATLYLLLAPSAASAVLAVAGTAYARTYMGHPGHTGARTWPRFQAYCQSVLSVALSRWFGTVRIVAAVAHPQHAADAEPSAEHAGAPPIVFGYHPHGMYPAAAAWFHLTPQWRDAFPGVSPVTMGASAIFWTPMLRDVVMWSGARIVSRLAVRRALQSERRPIVLCPGGQAELVEHRAGAVTVLCTRHKGFIKCAIEAGAPVCPIFVFGESQAQRNLLSVKGLQRWTAKRLGFPFPFIPGGYMRVLPLPEPKPLTFVVGPQLPPPPGRTLGAPASDAEVDAVHKLYYAALVELFEAHKAAAGFPEATLVLKDD